MAKLKRIQSARSQDSDGLKRQSLAAAAELENTQSSTSANHSTASATPPRTTKAQSIFGLDDLAISKLSPPAAFTHILDVAPPVDPSLRGEDFASTSSTLASTVSPSQSRASRAPGKMTSRSPEQEFGNVRALSRFLRATGPLDLDEADFGHSSSSQSFSLPRPAFDRPVLTRSLNSAPPPTSLNPRLPVSSSDYFRALDARLDQYDQDINVEDDDIPPPVPAKSIRKSRSIGESFSVKPRARSHSAATRLDNAGTISSPTVPPSPPLPNTLAVSPSVPPSPLHISSGNAPQSSTGHKLKGFGGLATILRRKKSGSATTTTTSRKGNGHNRRAGIGSDDFFAPPSELGILPSGDVVATGSKASPFSFRRYATQAADTPLPPIFRTRKGTSTSPSRVTDADTSGEAESPTGAAPILPLLQQASPIFTPPPSSPVTSSSSLSHKQKRIPVPKYDSQTTASIASSAKFFSPSTFSHSARNQSAFGDYAGYGDDDDNRSDAVKGGEDRVERISIDGDLGEFCPSPGPEQQRFSASPTAESPSQPQLSPTTTSGGSGVGPETSNTASSSDSYPSDRSSLDKEKNSSESERLAPILVTEPTPRPSTTSSGSTNTATATPTTTATASVSFFSKSTGSPKKEKLTNGLHQFPMAGAVGGTGSMTPPLSPPPTMPLPLLPTSRRPSLSLVGALASSSSQSGSSPTRLLTPSTISSLPSTSTSLITSSPTEAPAADSVPRHASAASLTPPPSSFVRLRARTLSPAKRPSTQPQFHTIHGPLSSASSSSSTFVLHSTVTRLEAELVVTSAQVEKMAEVTKTMMEALRAAEAREALLLERVERLERAVSASALRRSIEASPSPRDGVRAIEASPSEGSSGCGNDGGGLFSESPSTATATADKSFPIATAQEAHPPSRRRLPRRRTLPPEVFHVGSLGSITVGVIRRAPSNASEDGRSTGTHLRNRANRRKSLTRSRSRSRASSPSDRWLKPPRCSTAVPSPSAVSVVESFYSALASPSPIAAETQMEAEFERRGTMSLFTSVHPRKKRALPLSSPTVSSISPPLSSTTGTTITEGTLAAKKRPALLLQRTGSSDTATSIDSPTSLNPPLLMMRVPRIPTGAAPNTERSSKASSLAAVDNNHLDSQATQRSSTISQTLLVPSSLSRSDSNSTSNSPSVGGPPSPSFEQLVDLLEDLAAQTPSSSGLHDSFETEANHAASIVVPPVD